MTTDSIPEGFTHAELLEGFLEHVGPLYAKFDPAGKAPFVLAFRAGPQHINRHGVVHGGMLATLADTAIGANLIHAAEIAGKSREATLTVNLSLDYLAGGRVGDWIEAHVFLTKSRGRIRFGQCEVRSGDLLLVRGSAVFTAIEVQPVR